MICYNCTFFDCNDVIHCYGTCEPQNQDFRIDHKCNLTQEQRKNIEDFLEVAKAERCLKLKEK